MSETSGAVRNCTGTDLSQTQPSLQLHRNSGNHEPGDRTTRLKPSGLFMSTQQEVCGRESNSGPFSVWGKCGEVFGNTPDFWLNVQRRNDLREALHTPKRMARPARARPIQEVTA
jgi:hypothetical protein